MPKNNTPPNQDASNHDSPPDSDAPDVLDTSGKGGPFIPAHVSPGPIDPPDSGGVDPQPPPPPPTATAEFVIEVELAPGVVNIDELLSRINAPGPPASGAEESDLARVARKHGLIKAQRIFTNEEVEGHRTRIEASRGGSLESVADGGSPEELSQLEALPRLTRYISLRFPAGASVAAVMAQLTALPEVRHAAVVPRAMPPSLPTDELIGTADSPVDVGPNEFQPQWYLHRTRVPQAWELGLGAGVVIADVDFGCHISHREFIGAIEHTHNSYDGTDNVTCGGDVRHGTAVLGIAGARADGKQIAGYAPEATLWAIRGDFGCGPRITNTPWKDAITHVLEKDAGGRRKVILVELETEHGGNFEQFDSIANVIRLAILQKCVVVVTAGNGDRRADLTDGGQPFAPTGSILVGATLADGQKNIRANYSNYGPTVVVSAPGDQVHDVTCSAGDTAYRNDFGGTSGAGAKVAGTVALMLSVNSHLSHAEVRDILHTTGSQIITDINKDVGVFLNAEAAVLEARNRLNN